VIVGVHAIVFSKDPEADRRFFRDVLGLGSVDAGRGWLIFELPPAELALHPDASGDRHELFLMCDEIERTVAELRAKGAQLDDDVSDQAWGLTTTIRLPGGGLLGLYEPRHASPILPSS
jgi:catechol 2,3-dioxygenase-like lactoylglutathione lyase family enzyme